VQTDSRAAPPDTLFQERKETVLPRWIHTPYATLLFLSFQFPLTRFPAGDLPPLFRRLERRKQPSLVVHSTIDSWDFPTALLTPSPTQSVHRRLQQTSPDSHQSIDEQDGKEDARNEQMSGGARSGLIDGESGSPSPETEHDIASRVASSLLPVFSPPRSNILPGAGSLATTIDPQSSLAAGPSTLIAFPTRTATPPSVDSVLSVSPSERPSPPSSPSLWSRIRRSTGKGEDAVRARSTFINVLQRGKRG
jgi:hypothetical protein